jgi:hypothetical protein
MDAEYEARVEQIKKQIAEEGIAGYSPKELEFFMDIRLLKYKEKKLSAVVLKQQEYIEALSELLDATRNELQKLDEVYYHVFPDRLEKDVRLGNQLRALKMVPGVDGDKKGS